MVQYCRTDFDAAFAALSDATRRGVLEQLGRADASITDLAERFDMTLTGMKKHVGVLEHAGLVATAKVGRVRTCTLGQRRLDEDTAWIDRYRQLWSARFDELDQVIEELKRRRRSMDARRERSTPMKNDTTVERKSEREVVITRTFNGPARIVFEAWTKPELIKRWWVPKSSGLTLLSCEMDVRTGGSYRFVFDIAYRESRWRSSAGISRCHRTRASCGRTTKAVTTERQHGDPRGTRRQDAARLARALSVERSVRSCRLGSYDGMPETFDQLDELLVTLGASVGRS